MKWVIVLPLLCLTKIMQVESGPQISQRGLNAESLETIKIHLKCASASQRKIMDNCFAQQANIKSSTIQLVAECILRRNNAIIARTQEVNLAKVKDVFVQKSSLSAQQKKEARADIDACIASHSAAKSSNPVTIQKTYLCTVDSMIVNGCAGQSAKLTNPQTQGDLIVYRNDVKNIQKLPNQQQEVIIRRTWLRRPVSGIDSQKQTQPDVNFNPDDGTVPVDYPTVDIEPIDPADYPVDYPAEDPTVINVQPSNPQSGIPSTTNITISIITLSRDIQVQLQILDGTVIGSEQNI